MLDYLYYADYNDLSIEADSYTLDSRRQVDIAGNECKKSATPESIEEGDVSLVATLPAKETHVHINAKIYVIADKYAINGLKDLSKRNLELNLEDEWKYMEFIPIVNYIYRPDNHIESELQGVLLVFAI